MFPLRGLWNAKPEEGDRFAAAEIDWGTYPAGQGVQFALSGNSPVAFTQIVALSVDNSRCGSDTQFIFADSGFVLQVPAHASGVYPVFTNGLMFYAVALNAGASDVTNLFVHNSLPPPLAVQLSERQNTVAVRGIALANGTTQLLPPTVSGTLNGLYLSINYGAGASAGVAEIDLVDSRGAVWITTIDAMANTNGMVPLNASGLAVRFFNGLSLVVSANTFAGNSIVANIYYTVP